MNPLDQQTAAEPLEWLYGETETRLMLNIVKHISDWDQPIASDEWQMQKLGEIGKLNQENIKIIAKYSGQSSTAIERMLNEVAEKVLDTLEPALAKTTKLGLAGEAVTVERSDNIKQAMKTMQSQAKDTLNICNTNMLYKARDAYSKLVQSTVSTAKEIERKQEYLNILNANMALVITGAESRQQALETTIKEFNEKGIPAFIDKRGREWTPEAYVNMAMRSTSNTCAAKIQFARCEDYGVDLVEVDSHSGARPKCARDQGKIFDRANKSDKYPHWNTSSYGEPDGLLGVNCGHHIYPYIEGVSIRRYFPTEDLEANDKLYREIQKQRAMERDVRKQKRECMLYDEIGDSEAFEKAAVKLKRKEAQLQDYVDGNDNLHRRKNREQVVGFNKKASSHALSASKRYQSDKDGVVASSRISQKNQKAAENWVKTHLGVKKTKMKR